MQTYTFPIPLIFTFFLAGLLSCGADSGHIEEPASAHPDGPDFATYWYQGKAELASYALEQVRYGEVHPGHAVLIFVTEDFSAQQQVKLDAAPAPGDTRIPILKLNFTKKFNTGIYPYSLMQSVFTPVDQATYPHSLKTSMSSQEWCGHTFTQLNLDTDSYRVRGFSYFQSEGDTDQKLPLVRLEDELWNLIRINPAVLPQGEQALIPGTFFSRLRHKPLTAERAILALQQEGNEMTYRIEYPGLQRTLVIRFAATSPYTILGWEETHASGWGAKAARLTTRATLKKTMQSPYWQQNNLADRQIRTQLGLPADF